LTKTSAMLFALFVCQVALPQTSGKDDCTPGDGRYCVYRKAETRTCKVWTADTLDGPQLLGPFDKQEDAVAAMCNVYSPGSDDPTKCSHTDPTDACKTGKSEKKKK